MSLCLHFFMDLFKDWKRLDIVLFISLNQLYYEKKIIYTFNVCSFFLFYSQGLENDLLRQKLSKICQCYLPHVKCYNFDLSSVFRPIQRIKFNKVSNLFKFMLNLYLIYNIFLISTNNVVLICCCLWWHLFNVNDIMIFNQSQNNMLLPGNVNFFLILFIKFCLKASYVILMKVNEILESCQRRQNVLCGALLSEERYIFIAFKTVLLGV